MTGSRPLVSVVIPTYNHAHLLAAALSSVCDQTYENWEAIVVNNFSDDDTVAVVEGFRDGRIQLVNFRNHGVIAASRNEGVRRSRGEYVAFLDSDDTWKTSKLARCVERLTTGCDLVCHGELWTFEDGTSRPVIYGPAAAASYRNLLYRGNRISTSATVVRTALVRRLGGFSENPAFVTAEDYEMWLRIARATDQICFIDDLLGQYRMHGSNASSAIVRNAEAITAVIRAHFIVEDARGISTHFRRHLALSRIYLSSALSLGKAGERKAAVLQAVRALSFWSS